MTIGATSLVNVTRSADESFACTDPANARQQTRVTIDEQKALDLVAYVMSLSVEGP